MVGFWLLECSILSYTFCIVIYTKILQPFQVLRCRCYAFQFKVCFGNPLKY